MGDNIFLFVPNIIGYARIILTIVSFYFMPTNYIVSGWCYVIGGLLDAVDGHAARHFNQSTKFGAMLDQLTDRCGTMGLLVVLSYFYSEYMFLFQLSMVIDISCHWIFLHSSVLQGRTSHKFIDLSSNPIMRLYYTNRPVLFWMCTLNEAFYISLYLMHFNPGPIVSGQPLFKLIAYMTAPFAIVKSLISVLHGYVACNNIAVIDAEERKKVK